MNKLLLIICAGMLALSSTSLSAQAPQQSRDSLHNKLWSIYLQGGVTIADGLPIESINAAPWTQIAPLYGLGISYNFTPGFRMSLSYEYSQYIREQNFSDIQPYSKPQLYLPNMKLEEMYGGQAYHRMWTKYHNVELTFDFNILALWKYRRSKVFNLYISTGAGANMGYGNSYDVALGHEHWSDPKNSSGSVQIGNDHEIYSWVNIENSPYDFIAPYLPAALSAEFNCGPFITLGIKAMGKYVFSDHRLVPSHLFGAAATLRFNFVGEKQGYRSYKKKYAEKRNSYNSLMSDYQNAKRECMDNAAKQADQIKGLEDENKELQKSLQECKSRPVPQPCKPELSVQFLVNSDKIGELEAIHLMRFIRKIKPNESVTLQLIGESSSDGNADYNQKLSEKRLARVISMLKSYGITEDRIIHSKAIGSSAGISDPEARRVTIKVN